MKITVKTTQQKVFTIEAEPTDTVGTLKNKIQETQGHAIASQRIIYAGKVLADDKLIEECKFKEKDFLVLMVSKPKPTPAPKVETAPAESTSTPAAATAADTTSTPAATTAAAPAAAAPAAAPGAAAQQGLGDSNSFLSGDALQTTIASLTDMGFPRDDVLRALRASYNNPDRAVEYLTMGIPEHLQAVANPPPAAAAAGATSPGATAPPAAPAPATTGATPATPTPAAPSAPQNLFQLAQQQQASGAGGALPRSGGGGGGGGQLDLAALQNAPGLQQLRELAQQNPALIQPLIQQMAAVNPELAQSLVQNPEALMQLLGVSPDQMGGDFEMGDEEGGGGVPPGAQVVNVSEEERAAIERLEALGFSRQAVIQAYFACDKNEELAANFLFEGGFDD
ncbi:hypothetical protein BDV98DRAFT_528178 [Pterulicium gracile]|uniref:UV excision repair protein RAD23 n=1 Tax=Pterulicium gracile TaxID=1884261 RepID=A0A5C3QL44_9AGAR|nr:hypothetical protein BDV98DRAFT_528178 [Pterula gracilis]